ncbi:unnamed protein product [Toxocara canis]|uniref:BAR domain-containing protein n=1 Tax=Toxocara canis TaxID=6265 RepID=A0A183UYP0_TOXCA|nr:unnamed protein product [Toxocara canis]
MAKKKSGDDYGLSKHGSEMSLDAALVACINNITDIKPSKVVIDVHKQLIVKFQPDVQKMSEAYVKSIDMLAESGNSAFPAARQRAVELKELASYMREVNRRHKETIGKFSLLVTKVNAYGHDEKEKLKEFHRSYEAREKAMKKSLHKKKQHDPDALEKFYVKERNLALRQQYQRYKFFVERHNEWLRDYMCLFGAFKQMFGELPIPETCDNAVNVCQNFAQSLFLSFQQSL